MKVYIVTSGTYSDYGIEAIFSTEELAKEYIDIHGDYDDRSIETWDLDSADLTRKNQWYEVTIFDYDTTCEVIEFGEPFDSVRYGDCFGGSYYEFCINADGAERAKKIASERLMQVKAQPYLFPRLKEKCVADSRLLHTPFFPTVYHYPTYNFHTKEIILCDGKFLKDEL